MRGLVVATLMMSFVMSSAHGGENTFIYVDRMPETVGALERTLTQQDERGGLEVVQKVFVEDYDHALIKTFVMSGECPKDDVEGGQTSSPKTFIKAIKYLPKRPATFAVATLHDIYKDVYVTDRDGKIRLYEDVAPQAMLELTEAFKPTCMLI